jgi:pyruvate-formate lyase-activating enzyme
MIQQGYEAGACLVGEKGRQRPACQITLKKQGHQYYRRITSVHLSRPENYLSIYQSGCNFSCRKCHSWYFAKAVEGNWQTPQQILKQAIEYETHVTLEEPREKATAWHAHNSCRCCGSCVLKDSRSVGCPGVLERGDIVLSPQGFGPARNIVAFTGGDVTCCPDFYCACARSIKSETHLWVLIETNGYGLTPQNLTAYRQNGVDAFWLDIKAFKEETHRWLTGCDNGHILKLPAKIVDHGFVLEVLSIYIPEVVETDQLVRIAALLAAVDPNIPFTVLAFFPEHRMQRFRPPNVTEMTTAYQAAKKAGLTNVRLGNLGIFCKTDEDRRFLEKNVKKGDY